MTTSKVIRNSNIAVWYPNRLCTHCRRPQVLQLADARRTEEGDRHVLCFTTFQTLHALVIHLLIRFHWACCIEALGRTLGDREVDRADGSS